MEKKNRPPWYRLLWNTETFAALLGTAVWGWLLLIPALGIAVGVVTLFGGSPADVKDTGTRFVVWLMGALSLFFGYCIGYVTGYDKKRDEAAWEDYSARSDFEETYQQDIADLQGQAEQQRKSLSKEVKSLSVQLETATIQCRVCGAFSEFLYRERDGSAVYGICGPCDRLIQSGERINLIPRVVQSLSERSGIDPSDRTLGKLAQLDVAHFTIPNGLAQERVERVPHELPIPEYDDFYDDDHRLTPKSWAEET